MSLIVSLPVAIVAPSAFSDGDRRRARRELLVDPVDILLRRGEDDRDRLQLGDGDDAGLLPGVHQVALVDEAEAGAPGDRRADGGVVELHLRGVDRRGVGGDLWRSVG